jgi:Fe-S cluster assembly protein SufD
LPSAALQEPLHGLDGVLLAAAERAAALDRFHSLPSGRERPGRFWRIDLESVAPDPAGIDLAGSRVRIGNPHARVVACDLVAAARERRELLGCAFGATSVASKKFGALARAFAHLGAFIYVPPDFGGDEPIVVEYDLADGAAVFPYTVVLAGRGARATVVERLHGHPAFVCGATEIVTDEHAQIAFVALQQTAASAQVFETRAARPGRNALVSIADAELGAALAVGDLSAEFEQPGAEARITALFFPRDTQHVDLASTVLHGVGETTSRTLVRAAATGRGQARYVGNISIAPHAQGSDASLRDDALLLSPAAHVDSVPALEIAANDVRAYHGATVGAVDDELIFYMESHGIARDDAERMIALGFFEPAIEHFPSNALQDEIRAAIEAKLP